MSYHLKRESSLSSIGTVYYADNNRWTNNYSERKIYENLNELNNLIAPTTKLIGDKEVPNSNGTFKNSVIVKE